MSLLRVQYSSTNCSTVRLVIPELVDASVLFRYSYGLCYQNCNDKISRPVKSMSTLNVARLSRARKTDASGRENMLAN